MPAELLWTPQAEEDLLDIYYFIASTIQTRQIES